MKTALIAVASLLVGALLSHALVGKTVRKQRRTTRVLRAKDKRMETMKKVVWACLVNGFMWVWCSYILAYLDRPQIAESLSQVAVTEIIGVLLVYGLKSGIENLSKNNNWPDKTAPPPEDDTTGVG